MALGELGRLKLKCLIYKRIMSFWCKLVDVNDESNICNTPGKCMKRMCTSLSGYKLCENQNRMCGFSNIWNDVNNQYSE